MASKVNREQNRNHHEAPCRATLRPIVFALMAAFGSIAHGLPTDPKVIAGQATVSNSSASSMVINQSSGKAAIDWRTFSVAGHESVRFAQPSASAMTVNRVTSNDPSQILGRISAPGSVYLINPAGVMFGKSAVVHVGNLVASTLNANPHDLLAGRMVFTADPAGAGVVRNEGQISTPAGGSVSLIGARVINSGHISTPGGTTGLIAGEKVAIDFDGDGLIRYQVDGAIARALVEHSGRIEADGGRVVMQARARDALLDTVLNVEGVVRARGVAVRNGEIHLDGGGSGVVSVSGQLDASTPDVARQGGEIRVLGDRVGLFGQARLDASGEAGGGTILIGGDYQGQGSERNATQTFVGPEVAIAADAGSTGDGGKVIVWADDWTRYHGTISAKGGEQGGDGGFVEVSGKRNLSFDGDVVTSAAKGQAGMLLLDPGDLYFSAAAVGGATELTGPLVFQTANATNDFYVRASRFIPPPAGTGSASSSYTLQAHNDFILNTNASFASTAGRTVSITAGNSIRSNNFAITTGGAALNLTAQSMTLGAVSTGVGAGAGALGINVTGVGQSATQSGAFSGGSLTKQGAGSLVLSQANTYTGGTLIQQGALSARHAQALDQGKVVVQSGATLNIDNITVSLANGLDLAGTGFGGGGALTGTGTAAYSGGVTLTADAAIGAATASDQLTVSGVVAGSAALYKTGAGTVALSGANTYTGGTLIQQGALSARHAQALNQGKVVVQSGATLNIDNISLALTNGLELSGAGAGGAGTLTGTGTAAYTGGITLLADSRVGAATTGDKLTLSGVISGATRKLEKVGSGTLILGNAGNTYSGGTTITAGSLQTIIASALPDNQAVDVGGSGTLALAGHDQAIGSLTGDGAVSLGSGTLTVRDGDFAGHIGGTGQLSKTSGGILILGESSTYTGGTTIQEGTLSARHTQALGQGKVTVASGGTLNINNVTLSLANGLDLAGTGAGGAGALTGTGTAAYTGGITLLADSRIGAATTGDLLTLSGVVAGSGGLYKVGVGTVALSGANTYAGGTLVQQGTLRARHTQALNQGKVTVESGGTLNIDGVSLSLGSGLELSGTGSGGAGALTGTGTAAYDGDVTLLADSRVGAATTGDKLTLSGVISGATRKLEKVGSGTLILGNAGNTYSGGTTITAGSLQTSVASALPDDRAVDVGTSGTLDLADHDQSIGTLTGAGAVSLGSGTLTVRDGDFAGHINGSGQLRKASSGTLILSNSSTYTGGTTIQAGTLSAQHAQALNQGKVTVGSGGTLNIDGVSLSLVSGLDLSGTGAGGAGALTGTGTAAYTGDVTLLADTTIGATTTGDHLTLSGVLTGAAGLYKVGAGMVALSGANSYTGGTLIQQGTLSAQHTQALNQGKVTVASGGTLNIDGISLSLANGLELSGTGAGGAGALTGTGTAAYDGNVTLLADSRIGAATTGDQLTLSGAVAGSGGLYKVGAGTVALSGANTYAGGTLVQQGTLSAKHTQALNQGKVTVASGGTLNIDGVSLSLASGLELSGAGAGGAGALTGTGTAAYTGGIALLADSRVGAATTGDQLTLNGVISGATRKLEKTGAGKVTLAGANTYGGGTTIQAGTLSAQHIQALNQGKVTVASGGTLNIDGFSLSLANGLELSGIGAGGAGALTGTGTAAYTGDVTLLADSRVGAATTGDQLTLSGVISGATRKLEKVGSGTLILDNAANSYSGGTTITAGTLQTSVTSALPDNQAVDVAGSGTLGLAGHDQSIGTLTGAGTISLGSGTLTVRDGDFAGHIGGSGQLSKTSGGTLILRSSNSYGGGTTIQAGTLSAQHAQALNQGKVTVADGGTLNIDGVSLSLASGLDLSGAGAGGAGALTGTGTATYTGGITLLADSRVGSATTGDQLTLNGVISGATRKLEKTGAGKVTLAGANTYGGGTTIQAGTLSAQHAQALNQGKVTVADGGTLNIDGVSLSLGSGLELSGTGAGGAGALTGTGTAAYTGGITLLANSRVGVAIAGDQLTLSGVISGATRKLEKTGAGEVTLAGANTYSGGTTIQAGTLSAMHAQALNQGKVTVASGATLNIDNIILSLANGLDLAGSGAGGAGALTGSGTAVYTGGITLLADSAIGAATASDQVILNGVVVGSAGLYKVGDGRVTLSGANTYTGGTIIQQGTLSARHSQALNQGKVTVADGATLNIDNTTLSLANGLDLSGTGAAGAGALTGTGTAAYTDAVTLVSDSRIGTATAGDQLTLIGVISGGNRLEKAGDGTLILGNTGNSYRGGTTITTGSLRTSVASALPDNEAVSVGTSGTLDLAGHDQSIGTLTGGGAISLGSGTLTVRDGDFAGQIGGSGQLSKTSGGTLILGNASTYTGGTTIQEGTLSARHIQALSQGKVTVASGGTLHIDNVTLSLANGLDLSGTGAGGAGALTGTGTAAYTDAVTLVSDSRIGAATAGDQLTLSGVISGGNRLEKAGDGTLILGNTGNSYSGGTTITAGSLRTSIASALPDNEVVSVGTSGTLDLAGHDQSIGTLTGGGAISLGSGTLSVRDGDFAGHIDGSGQLSKTSGGTLILSNSSTYTGGTTIQEGTLSARHIQALSQGKVTVASGGTLNIDNTTLSLANGLDLSGTGAGGAGALTGTGTAAYTDAVTLVSDSRIGTATAGDQLTLSGVISGGNRLEKAGDGTLILGNTGNSYRGGTTITAGSLRTSIASALPDNEAVSVGTSGTLDLAGHDQSIGTLTGGGAISLGSGTLTVRDGDFAGQIGGSGQLSKTSSGTLILGNASTYTGGTTIQQGTLSARHDQALSQGKVTVASGGTLHIDNVTLSLANGLDLSGTGAGGAGALTGTGTAAYTDAVTLVSDSRIGAATAGDQLTLSGVISGGNRLEKAGDGTLILGNTGNSYSGGTTITAGSLRTSIASALPDNEVVSVGTSGTLDLAGHDQSIGTLTGGGAISLGSGTLSVRDGDFAGHIDGSGQLSKTSGGTLILSNSSTYTGGTTIQEGTLSARHIQALSQGKVTVASGGTLNIDNTTLSLANGLDLSGTGAGGAGALTGTGTAAYTDAVTLVSDSRIGTATAGDQLTLSGVISGGNRLEKAGDGTLILGNTGNSYSGGTTITAGSLRTSIASALPDNEAVSVGTSGTLDLAGHDQSIGTLTGGGAISLGSGTLTVRDGDFAGQIGGSGQLSKTSSGTLILGNASTYTGGATIQEGMLSARHAQALSQGKVTVASGGTLNIDNVALSLANGLDLSGTGAGGAGALAGTGTAAYIGAISLLADAQVSASSVSDRLSLQGVINGGGQSLTIAGSGTLVLAGGVIDAQSIEQLPSSRIDLGSGQTVESRSGQVYRGVVNGTDVRLTSTQGGSIEAMGVGNDFSGRVTVNAQDVSLRDGNTFALEGRIGGNLTTTSQALLLGATTVGGTATLNAGGAVTQDGDVQVSGTTAIHAAGQTVRLSRSANDFTGRVTVTAQEVTLGAKDTLDLAATVSGDLSTTSRALNLGPTRVAGTAVFSAGGPLTQDGDVHVTGTTTIDAAGQNITLDRPGNDLGGGVTVIGHDLILHDADTLDLEAHLTGSLTTAVVGSIDLGLTTIDGDAAITASGAVTQSGDLTVQGRLWVNAAGQSVTLAGPNNEFQRRVTVTAHDVTLAAKDALDLAATVSGDLSTSSQALNLGPTTVTGTATLNAAGAVTQDGDVQVSGTTAINAAGQDVTLDRPDNDFVGVVKVTGHDLILHDANTLNLDASVTGSLTTAVVGNIDFGTTTIHEDAGITASGAVTQSGDLTVEGRLWVNADGQSVTLDGPNNEFRRRVTVTAHDVTLRAKDALDLAATVSGDLSTSSQALNLGPTNVAGTAVLTTGGPLTQDGDLQVSGTTTINAPSQNVQLDRAGNDFGGRVSVTARDVSLQDGSALNLAATTTGTLKTTSQGLLLGPTTVDGIARISSSGPVTQDGDLLFKSTTTIDAPGQPVTLDRPDNDFAARLTLTAGETALRDRNLIEARLDTTNTQLTAGQLKLEGQVRLAGSSLWSSRTAIELGNLDFAGSGTAHLVSNKDGAAMRTNKVEGVSVQDAAGTPLELFIYDAGIFQSAGTTIASDPGVTLSLEAGKASIDLTAGAKVSAKPAGLVGLVEAFAIPVDGQEITHPGGSTNRLLGPLMAVTSDDRAQTGGVKSIVAIASDTIRVAASPTPVVNSDTVMLLGRVIEGGGGSIQTSVAATQRRGGGNIATDPAGVNDNGVSILPSIFLIADDPGGSGGFYYGSEVSPIAVSFGGTGTAGNSTLQTIAPYPFRKTGGAAGPVPIYLSTINNGGVGPTGTVQVLLARPAAVALSDVRTVVIDGRMVVDTSAYQSIQSANAAILNQVRIEQFESGFSNENVAAQLRKGVITETGVGEAAVDRFLGVAGTEACDGAVASGTLSCVAAPDAAN